MTKPDEELKESEIREDKQFFPCCCPDLAYEEDKTFNHTEASKFIICLLDESNKTILDKPIFDLDGGELQDRGEGKFQQTR